MVGQWVEGNVIDTWTHILNEREKYRAATSPLRLFCTIDTTVCIKILAKYYTLIMVLH